MQIIKIDADFFIFYLSQRHEGHKEAIFSKAFFVSFVPLREKITSAKIHEICVIWNRQEV